MLKEESTALTEEDFGLQVIPRPVMWLSCHWLETFTEIEWMSLPGNFPWVYCSLSKTKFLANLVHMYKQSALGILKCNKWIAKFKSRIKYIICYRLYSNTDKSQDFKVQQIDRQFEISN
jgi:hypothetical protein